MLDTLESTRDLDADLSAPSDSALLAAVRAGNTEAYGILFARHHRAALRLARRHCRTCDAQDVVAESFVQVLKKLRDGKGPDEFFRAYLFTAVRREAWRRNRDAARTLPVGDEQTLESLSSFDEGDIPAPDHRMAMAAFDALPDRWRNVLWSLDVEGRKPQDLAAAMHLTPNAVSALAYRAREALREAYLDEHVNTDRQLHDAICESILHSLARVVRDSAAPRETRSVLGHLAGCVECSDAFRELTHANMELTWTREFAGSVS